MCEGFWLVENERFNSGQYHNQLVGLFDDKSVNCTDSGALPLTGVAEKSVTGTEHPEAGRDANEGEFAAGADGTIIVYLTATPGIPMTSGSNSTVL